MKTTNQPKPSFNEWVSYIRKAANKANHELTAADCITKFKVNIKYEN